MSDFKVKWFEFFQLRSLFGTLMTSRGALDHFGTETSA